MGGLNEKQLNDNYLDEYLKNESLSCELINLR